METRSHDHEENLKSHKIRHWWLADQVRDVQTIDTGGNIRNDVLTLKGGQVVVITSDCITLYESFEHYENGGNGLGTIIRF